MNVGKKILFHEGVPENVLNAEGKACLIILDDLLKEVYSKEVCHLFTKGSHHRNISVIPITQNLLQHGRYCRKVSLNAKFLVLLKKVRDKNQFSHLSRLVYPEVSVGLYEAYLDATKQPYGYFLLNLSQDTEDLLRFRTNIFPKEYPPVIYAPVSYEWDKVQISRATNA